MKRIKEPLCSCLEEGRLEAGCDEAGRGCLAGPVVAAAVVLPPQFDHPQLYDSKQISEKVRNSLRILIESEALAWAVASASPGEIDEMNILKASFLAMNRAITLLRLQPEYLLIDGNRFISQTTIPHTCIVRGDARYRSIAAASVLAKTHRDEWMVSLHREYPYYGWNRNKGYPTAGHRRAIVRYGITPWHRTSFRLTDEQLSIW